MIQNTPWNGSRKLRMATVRDYPNDIRPSKFTHFMAHVGGTTAEIVMPLILLFSPWPWLTWIAHRVDVDAPHVHHLHHPARGAARVERVLHVLRGVPVRQLPGRRWLRGRRHEPGAARRRGRVRPVPDRARRHLAAVRVVPDRDEAVRRQLGLDHVVVPRQGEGGPPQRAHREGRRQPDRPDSSRCSAGRSRRSSSRRPSRSG